MFTSGARSIVSGDSTAIALGEATCSCAVVCATLRLPVTTMVLVPVVSGSASVGLVLCACAMIGIAKTDAISMDLNVKRQWFTTTPNG